MILQPIRLPKRLHAVPELGPYDIHVGALCARHIGLTVAARRGRNTLTGPLMFPPTESRTKPLLVLHLGDFAVALHPAATVIVVPENFQATIVIAPKAHAPLNEL